jgi:hypothetical protein
VATWLTDDRLMNHAAAYQKAHTIAQPKKISSGVIAIGDNLRVEALMRQIDQRAPKR